MNNETVIVLDFGGQYNQLIARRVRECNVYCEIMPYKSDIGAIKAKNPVGIIFTGGPNSVYELDSPKYNNEIYNLGIEEALSPLGRKIKVYNIEKTICDLLKTESDIQITKDAIKMYCNSKNRNITKLTEYAKKLNVESKILTYLKVLL